MKSQYNTITTTSSTSCSTRKGEAKMMQKGREYQEKRAKVGKPHPTEEDSTSEGKSVGWTHIKDTTHTGLKLAKTRARRIKSPEKTEVLNS